MKVAFEFMIVIIKNIFELLSSWLIIIKHDQIKNRNIFEYIDWLSFSVGGIDIITSARKRGFECVETHLSSYLEYIYIYILGL